MIAWMYHTYMYWSKYFYFDAPLSIYILNIISQDLKGVITQINDHLGCPFPRDNLDLVVEASSFNERKKSYELADKDAEVKLKLHKKLSKLFGTESQSQRKSEYHSAHNNK